MFVTPLLALALSACTTECGTGFVKGEDGNCYAVDTGETDADTDADTDSDTDADTDSDTDTDTDADTDADTPVSATVQGSLTVIGAVTAKGICNVSVWSASQLVDGMPPGTKGSSPRGGADVVCPADGGTATFEVSYNDPAGELSLAVFAMVEPDGNPDTHDAMRGAYAGNPLAFADGDTLTGADITVTLGGGDDTAVPPE